MKERYSEPDMKVTALSADDVVRTSDTGDNKQPVEMGLGVGDPAVLQ